MGKKLVSTALSSFIAIGGLAANASADSYSTAVDYDIVGNSDSASHTSPTGPSATNLLGGGNIFDPGDGTGEGGAVYGWGEGSATSSASGGVYSTSDLYVEVFSDNTTVPDSMSQVTSNAVWEQDFTAAYDGNFSWETIIPSIALEIYEGAGFEATSQFTLDLIVNNLPVTSVFAMLHDDSLSSSSLLGTPDIVDVAGTSSQAHWTGPISFGTDLGHFMQGDVISVKLDLSTMVMVDSQQLLDPDGQFFDDSYSYARVGDPGGLNVPGILTGTPDPVNNPVPEPSTMLLLGAGLAGIIGSKRRKK